MATQVIVSVPAPLDKALPYLKFVAACIVGAGMVAGTVVALPHWALIVMTVANAASVYFTPNVPVKPPALPPADPAP